MTFQSHLNRLRVEVNENGLKDHAYSHGAKIMCPDGWNDSCRISTFVVSVNELRDLRYLLDRAIATADLTK